GRPSAPPPDCPAGRCLTRRGRRHGRSPSACSAGWRPAAPGGAPAAGPGGVALVAAADSTDPGRVLRRVGGDEDGTGIAHGRDPPSCSEPWAARNCRTSATSRSKPSTPMLAVLGLVVNACGAVWLAVGACLPLCQTAPGLDHGAAPLPHRG